MKRTMKNLKRKIQEIRATDRWIDIIADGKESENKELVRKVKYILNRSYNDDFECSVLMAENEDEKEDIILIVAGYPDELYQMYGNESICSICDLAFADSIDDDYYEPAYRILPESNSLNEAKEDAIEMVKTYLLEKIDEMERIIDEISLRKENKNDKGIFVSRKKKR